MAMLKYGYAAVATPVVDQGKWIDKKVPAGRIVVAKNVIAKYDPSQWLLSHCTIVASVDVDLADPKNEKTNYLIKPEYSIFVNNNGDSWERELLKGCYKTFLGADNYCFPAGTRVLMSDGTYKSIELIKEGDRVINRKGETGTVTKTFKRQTKDLVELSGNNILSRKLFTTRNHPFWVYRARKICPKTGRPNFFDRDRDFWHLPEWVGFSVGVHKHKGEEYPCGLIPDWVEASDIDSNRDFFTHPVSSVEIPNDEVNENRAELIGWYLAEGFLGNWNKDSDDESNVTFALGNTEQDVANKLSDLLIKEFGENFREGCQPRIYETQSGSINLFLSNKVAALYFKKWCGKYAWAKKLAEEAMWLPKKLQAIILKSCIDGDGSRAHPERGYSLEMKSQALIQQMNWIAWRLGLLPTYKEVGVIPRYTECEMVDGYEVYTEPATGKKSRPGYLFRLSTRDSKAFNKILDIQDDEMSDRLSKKYAHIFDNSEGKWIVSKIDYVKPSDVMCDVYNIEVEGDNSYVVEGVTVHNCEHVQIPELSKGKVIDVVLREIPFTKDNEGKDLTTLYVDILIATSRKHTDIVEKITSGEYSNLSMGCLIKFSICSQCGSIAEDESKACKHVKYFKNNFFYDKNGVKRIICELCGHKSDPESNRFIDASWVRKPAFEGAVLRNIIQPNEDVAEKLQTAVAFPSFQAMPGMNLRAASMAAQQVVNEIEAQEAPPAPPPKDDVGFPPAAPGGAPAPAPTPDAFPPMDPLGGPGAPPPAPGTDPLAMPPMGGAGAPPAGGLGAPPMPGMPGTPGAQPGVPPVQVPLEDATAQEVSNMLKTQVLNKIRKEILEQQALETQKQRPTEMENASNNSLVKNASFTKLLTASKKISNHRLFNGLLILSNIKDWKEFRKYGYDRNDVLGMLYYIDKTMNKKAVGSDAVKAMSKVKLASGNLKGFFTELILEIGRKPEKFEADKLASWGRILSNFD